MCVHCYVHVYVFMCVCITFKVCLQHLKLQQYNNVVYDTAVLSFVTC